MREWLSYCPIERVGESLTQKLLGSGLEENSENKRLEVSAFESLGFLYVITATVAFTASVAYFTYKGIRQTQREIEAGQARRERV